MVRRSRARPRASEPDERAAGLGELIELHERDASEFPLEPEAFDAALCLGASFVWDGLPGTLAALEPAVRAAGHVVVGERYWRSWPLSPGVEEYGFTSMSETAARFRAAGLSVDTLIVSSEDDWRELLGWAIFAGRKLR